MFRLKRTNISQKEFDDIRIEYGEIFEKSVIKNNNYATLDVFWNVFTIQKFLNIDFKKSGRKTKRGISDDENWINISRKSVRKAKENYLKNDGNMNVSMT